MNLQRYFHFFLINFLIFIFFVVNIAFLSQYPFIHSDESWLSGLTRAIIENKNIAATEPFFDLLPRFPHAIKILFHFLQIPFILVLGYRPFSVRLPSLLAGTASLFLLNRILNLRSRAGGTVLHPWLVTSLTLLFAADIQFIYASHFARQEIFLVLFFLLALLFYHRGKTGEGEACFRWSAMSIGLSIGLHPNSFLIALPIGGFLILDYLASLRNLFASSGAEIRSATAAHSSSAAAPVIEVSPRTALRRLGEYAGILLLSAALFVSLSFLMDPDFLRHYLSFGESVGVTEPLYMKVFTFPDFYEKIFRRISGTYYLPDIRFQFYLFAAILGAALPMMVFSRRARSACGPYVFGILLLNLGTLVLGKYSQPSIILHFPLYYLLLGEVLGSILTSPGKKSLRAAEPLLVLLLLAQAVNTGSNLWQTWKPVNGVFRESYQDYGNSLRRFVPEDAMVLANLNAEYFFDFGHLRDYRNLAFLEEQGLDFSRYIEKNQIQYILYPEEMDFIHERRPVWNILYGNVTAYYEDMQAFLTDRCTEVGSFSSPVYGMRITRYSGSRNWKVRVYRVDTCP